MIHYWDLALKVGWHSSVISTPRNEWKSGQVAIWLLICCRFNLRILVLVFSILGQDNRENIKAMWLGERRSGHGPRPASQHSVTGGKDTENENVVGITIGSVPPSFRCTEEECATQIHQERVLQPNTLEIKMCTHAHVHVSATHESDSRQNKPFKLFICDICIGV